MRLISYLAAIVFAATFTTSAMAQNLALVIQNTDYFKLNRIRDIGPSFDQYTQAYRDKGFSVISVNNAGTQQMRRALIEFETRARTAQYVVIDFTGYVATHGDLFLPKPTDAQELTFVERYTEAPSLQMFFELMRQYAGRSAIVLAAPDRGIETRIRTKARIPDGVIVLAGPHKDVRQAVTTRFLGDTSVSRIANGKVWVGGIVTDQPFLPRFSSASQSPAPSDNDVFIEVADWRAATQANTAAALNGYLRKYPNGLFVTEARARLNELTPPAQRAEQALGLTRAQRRQVQEQLTLLGHNTRGIDGIWGNGTRAAIRRWQGSQGFRTSGFVDRPQLNALARQAQQRAAEVEAEKARQSRATEQADLRFWQDTGSGTNEAGLRAYLQRYPDGLFSSQAKRALAQVERSRPQENPQALAQERALGLTPQMRVLAEQRLRAQGLNPGPVDGTFDARTRQALRAFQQSAGMRATGYMNRQTVAALIVSSFR